MLLHDLKTLGVDERFQIGLLLLVIAVQLYNEIGIFHVRDRPLSASLTCRTSFGASTLPLCAS